MFQLIANNPFRILGVYANATTSSVSGSSMRLTASLRKGLNITVPAALEGTFGSVERTLDKISAARSELQRPEGRLENGLFWFTRADDTDTKALDALGKGDMATAEELWKAAADSVSARHNLAVFLLARGYVDEAAALTKDLSDNSSRELCALLAPGTSLTSKELNDMYTRLAPASSPVRHEHRSEMKPRPAVARKPRPATGEHYVRAVPEQPETPSEQPVVSENKMPEKTSPNSSNDYSSIKDFKPDKHKDESNNDYLGKLNSLNRPADVPLSPVTPVAETPAETATQPLADSGDDVKHKLQEMSLSLQNLRNAGSMNELMLAMNELDGSMCRLRNVLENSDPRAYRSWADGSTVELMKKLSSFEPFPRGSAKAEQALSMLARARTWGLSPNTLNEINNYWSKIRNGSKSNVGILIAVLVIIIVLLNTCLS